MSNDVAWEDCDGQIAGKIIRVYDLRQERVRIDSTTVSGHWEEGELFAFGKSKDNRPDLVQVKVNIATLDPLGIPVSTTVVSGSKADDPLYVPEIQKVQKSVQEKDLLYVGDCKMSSLDTRSYIVRSGNHYLSPLCPDATASPEGTVKSRISRPTAFGTRLYSQVRRPTRSRGIHS